jgi:hypothetical protein
MRRFAIVCLLSFAVIHEAHALNVAGETVIVPVVGRFPGAGGTQWQTDLFLANPGSPTYVLTLRLYPSGEPMIERTISMQPFSSQTLTDVCLNTFGRANVGGMLEIIAGIYTIQARARIYNIGNPAGQFGQNVPGIGFGRLSRQAYLYGLSTSSAYRLNIGVANPNNVATNVTITVQSANNTILHTRTVTVQPHQFTQINDIRANIGLAPQESLVVNMFSPEQLIYGYASEVRNDTGDAVFIFGVSPNL